MTDGEPRLVVRFLRLAHAPDAPPLRMTGGSAGFDLAAAVEAPVAIEPGGRALVPTGYAIALPPGHEAQVRSRSGLAARHGVVVLNSPGTVDADYRGEVKVVLINHGEEPFRVERGDRIAQLVVQRVASVRFEEETELSPTERDSGGFGSTGIGAERDAA